MNSTANKYIVTPNERVNSKDVYDRFKLTAHKMGQYSKKYLKEDSSIVKKIFSEALLYNNCIFIEIGTTLLRLALRDKHIFLGDKTSKFSLVNESIDSELISNEIGAFLKKIIFLRNRVIHEQNISNMIYKNYHTELLILLTNHTLVSHLCDTILNLNVTSVTDMDCF